LSDKLRLVSKMEPYYALIFRQKSLYRLCRAGIITTWSQFVLFDPPSDVYGTFDGRSMLCTSEDIWSSALHQYTAGLGGASIDCDCISHSHVFASTYDNKESSGAVSMSSLMFGQV